MFYNKTVAIYLILITSIMQYGCSPSEDENECNDTYQFPNYDDEFEADNNKILSLQILSGNDTIYSIIGNSETFNAQALVEYSKTTHYTNSGIISQAEYIKIDKDTLIFEISSSNLCWHSSDENILEVMGETMEAKSSGIVKLNATLNNIQSNNIYINVSSSLAPILDVYNPVHATVNNPETIINGRVISKSAFNLTINGNLIEVSSFGTFEENVGLNMGENIFEMIATNNDALGLSTNTRRYVTYERAAPVLEIDGLPVKVVFEPQSFISGRVIGHNYTLTINTDTIDVSSEGSFNKIVDLDYGNNIFQIEAQNNDGSNLNTTKSVTIIYLSFDDITGHWKGETITRPFSFDIYKLADQYIINGTLTVDLTFFGGSEVVQDIAVIGLINNDGTIDAQLSKEASDMIISGSLKGHFSTSGIAAGSYTLSFEFYGVPFSHTEEWTAEKQ